MDAITGSIAAQLMIRHDQEAEQRPATHFIVQTAAAPMPSGCWGTYKRVAVLEVESHLDVVSMISTHARGCLRVVQTWEKLNVGTSERCAYRVALKVARAMADELNGAL